MSSCFTVVFISLRDSKQHSCTLLGVCNVGKSKVSIVKTSSLLETRNFVDRNILSMSFLHDLRNFKRELVTCL